MPASHLPTSPVVPEAFPQKIVAMVESSCAARCPSCPFSSWNSPIRENLAREGKTSMDWDIAQHLTHEVGKHGAWLHITGAGEPFQWPWGMTRLIEYAKTWGARTWVNTHGNLVGPDVAVRLLNANHDLTEFSVDAADEKTYAVVRRGLSWNLLLSNIDTMLNQRARRSSSHPSRIIVSVILQDALRSPSEQRYQPDLVLRTDRLPEAERIAEVEKFWLDRGVDHVSFRKFLTWGSQSSIDSRHAITPDAYLSPEDGEPCPYPFERMGVDSTGRIVICNADITGQTDFGNLHDPNVTIEKAWNSDAMRHAREMHACGRGREASAACKGCTDWSFRSWTHNFAAIDQKLTQIGGPR